MLNGAPVLWGSKVSSVCFAHPDIGEAHADISSGAAEVYAAGNATFEFLHLSYTADEMGIPFPKPFTMQVDNKAAIAFSDNSAFKSKLKHIDVRQEWVQTLRNKSIITPKYVRSEDNLADLFTKILTADIFEKTQKQNDVQKVEYLTLISCSSYVMYPRRRTRICVSTLQTTTTSSIYFLWENRVI